MKSEKYDHSKESDSVLICGNVTVAVLFFLIPKLKFYKTC